MEKSTFPSESPVAPPPRHDAILARLRKLHPRVIDLSLGRIGGLLADLGHPEAKLPPVIHVAGTNGKGSLIAYLRAMLEAAGKRVHVYTSPHLVRFNERIRLAGGLIGDDALEAVLEEVERVNAGRPMTEFEMITAAALLAFSRIPADALLLETGLGGEFDATNVVDRPVLTAITPIDFDHMEFLGPHLETIAAAKAGIMKEGAPCICGPQRPEAAAVLRARAAALGIPLIRRGVEYDLEPLAGGFRFRDADGSLDLPLPALPGAHQVANAATAIACLRSLPGLGVDAEAMAAGLRAVEWPARLQRLRRGPLTDLLGGRALWLDGGHNPHCAEAVAAFIRERPPMRRHLIVGMKANKDLAGFLRPFVGLVGGVTGIDIPEDPNCHPPAAIAAAASALGIPGATASGAAPALAALAGEAGPEEVFILGSLYLAGAILAENA